MIINPEHAKVLVKEPLQILPALIEDQKFNNWTEISDYLRDIVSQDIIKSSYLILLNSLEKLYAENDQDDVIMDKYLDDLDVFWCALTDENAAKIELIVRN